MGYSTPIDTDSQQPQQYGSCEQEQKGNTERCKRQVPGGTQRALDPKGSKGPRQDKLAGVDTPQKSEYTNMTAAQQARLQHLLAVEFLTPFEDSELDALMQLGQDEYNAERWERESRQELWAESGGYLAGLARPL